MNQSLVTQNFVQNALKSKAAKSSAKLEVPKSGPCAIPLLEVERSKSVDPMPMPALKNTGDDKMILPTIPVCPAK